MQGLETHLVRSPRHACGAPSLRVAAEPSHTRAPLESLPPPPLRRPPLQVEEGTPFARRYSPGEAPLPSDDSAAAMYRQASGALRAAGALHGGPGACTRRAPQGAACTCIAWPLAG